MNLAMGKLGNVPTDLQEGIRDALGRRTKVALARAVNLEVKPDKYEARIIVLTDYRLHILTSKPPMKVDTNFHFLDISLLESKSPKKMTVGMESKRLVMMSMSQDQNTDDFDLAVGHILASLAKVFPSVPTERLIAKVDFSPSERLQESRKMVANAEKRDQLPCGNFTAMYHCICDYHNLEYQEDVAWDINNIYLSQNSKEMNLSDFDHLDSRHFVPIISALEHNTWFTRLNASNVKLTPEAVNEILRIMKTNITIEELVLANIGARSEFAQRLCLSLVANTGSPLTVLDLSENPIEDKGLNHLCAPITKLSRGLVELNLARTGITARGVNQLALALISNKNILLNLRCLNLKENSFKGEDITNLFNFLAQPNSLTDLRLGSTECALENLFAALQRGCAQNLTHLDISRNVFSYRKPGKDLTAPPTWKQFFASAVSLRTVNFSGCRLPSDALRCVLEGVGSNSSLTDFELNLSSNNLGLPGNLGGQILEQCLSTIRNISHLDISDNGFDVALASILGKLSQNKSLRKLSIGRNLNNVKPKTVPQVIEAIIQLIHLEHSPIECLNVDNLRLKSDTTLLINALGNNETLKQIDISGNHMGDFGARMLSKALQINKKLSVIYWDHNDTSPAGFQDIAAALEKNFTVRKMPTPINDAALALRLNQEKTEQALQKIEAVLQRNHSPRKLPTDQAYRLQQGFMVSSSQQIMDRHLVRLQDLIEKLQHLQQQYQTGGVCADVQPEVAKAQALLQEAESARTFLLKLQKVVEDADGSESLLQMQLKSLATSLHDTASKQLSENVSSMIECAGTQFPVTLSNVELQEEITTSAAAKSVLSKEFIRDLVMDHLAADVTNKTSELNLTVASHISDCILDEVINAVEKSVQSLTYMLNKVRSQLLVSGQLKDEDKESREHRESLRRNKSSSSSIGPDEEQDLALEMPLKTEKHKSQLTKRLRPQSAVGNTADLENGKIFQDTRPKLSEPSLDFFPPQDSSVPKLQHVVKDRPKRPKTKAITRPTAYPQIIDDEDDVSRGVSEFFETKHSPTIERKATGNGMVPEEQEEVVAKADASGKKAKAGTFSPKTESKGIASGFMNLFKKKSPDGDAPPTAKSNSELSAAAEGKQSARKGDTSEQGDDSKGSEETLKKEAEEPVEKPIPKQPPHGMGKIGLPGMAGGLNLAEIRAKRATAKPSSGPSESSLVDRTKETRSTDRKSSQSKENVESSSTEENYALQSRLSTPAKVRPPPAPKPKNRSSVINPNPSTNAAPAPKPAIPITRGLSEAEEAKEPEQKVESPQVIDSATVERRKRLSVREKAANFDANVDKNSNLKSVDNVASSKKAATLPMEVSSQQLETLTLNRPSSDNIVSLTSSSSVASSSASLAAVEADSEPPPPVPSDPPPGEDEGAESVASESSGAKRLSNVDVIHI